MSEIKIIGVPTSLFPVTFDWNSFRLHMRSCHQLYHVILFTFVASIFMGSCSKYKDEAGEYDPRLKRPYCNDPEAVNYNWDFPGTPDSTVCYYPEDMLSGNYTLLDSIYSSDDVLDTLGIRTVYFSVYPLSRGNIGLVGLCGSDTLFFTTDRFYFIAADSLFEQGQPYCSPLDTFTGTMRYFPGDTSYLQLNLTVDGGTLSGIRYHRGTAIKQ